MSKDLLNSLKAEFPDTGPRPSLDCPAFNVTADDLIKVCLFLRDKFDFDMLVDIAGVDWNDREPRFGVFYHLLSTRHHRYVRLATECPDSENPKIPSLTPIWPAANWHEREAFDMFGIRFAGHPDLRRILMWDEYPYFPLRKDFPLAGKDTELADHVVGEKTGARTIPAPMMGGPFTARPGRHMSENEPSGKDQAWTERTPKPDPMEGGREDG